MKDFLEKIKKFNTMYENPTPNDLVLPTARNIDNFHGIIQEEVEEGEDLVRNSLNIEEKGYADQDEFLDILTEYADWLGDMIVYCHTEARKWGLPMDKILDIIMESNFSKLAEDGSVLKDDRNKILKGPNYWKPEPKIRELLRKKLESETNDL